LTDQRGDLIKVRFILLDNGERQKRDTFIV
jgi:hypothetical protein